MDNNKVKDWTNPLPIQPEHQSSDLFSVPDLNNKDNKDNKNNKDKTDHKDHKVNYQTFYKYLIFH